MTERFSITTAIDYTNGPPHLGHTYEKVLADVIARHQRLRGKEVFFLTGVDQHGQKVQQTAEREGTTPQAYVDELTVRFRALWARLDVDYTAWAATTDTDHQTCVRKVLQRLWDDRDPATGQSRWIYKAIRAGHYSIRQEQFLTEKEMGPDGTFGPEWGQVEYREEENYYFRLEPHREWLLALIDARSQAGRPFVVPDFRVAELRNAVEKLAGDLCISRPKVRLSWGIELPFDPDYVTYVWFDALVNYVSFAPGYDPAAEANQTSFEAWLPMWHVIGKDILIPAHGVYWPIMLHALGFTDEQMPTLLVHGWWTVDGEKMSKSLGNVVDPDALADRFGAEPLRYFLMSEATTGRDADFTEERLIGCYNTDLANNLGNLFNRTLTMVQKYRGGRLRRDAATAELDGLFVPDGGSAEQYFTDLAARFSELPPEGNFTEPVLAIARLCNQQIQEQQPWELFKNPAKADVLDAFLYYLAESIRLIAIFISPVLPGAAGQMLDQLNCGSVPDGGTERFWLADARWGVLPHGHRLNAPTPLFPRWNAAKTKL